ncbi:hypothetical protein AAZX31_20G027800 [Glycine max]
MHHHVSLPKAIFDGLLISFLLVSFTFFLINKSVEMEGVSWRASLEH